MCVLSQFVRETKRKCICPVFSRHTNVGGGGETYLHQLREEIFFKPTTKTYLLNILWLKTALQLKQHIKIFLSHKQLLTPKGKLMPRRCKHFPNSTILNFKLLALQSHMTTRMLDSHDTHELSINFQLWAAVGHRFFFSHAQRVARQLSLDPFYYIWVPLGS